VGYSVEIGDKKAQLVIRERCSTTSYLKNFQSEIVVFQVSQPVGPSSIRRKPPETGAFCC
jgi:hypothetical protein